MPMSFEWSRTHPEEGSHMSGAVLYILTPQGNRLLHSSRCHHKQKWMELGSASVISMVHNSDKSI
eukprot:scaffold4226_cov180-Amphora_coffeaeformis.AAC.5